MAFTILISFLMYTSILSAKVTEHLDQIYLHYFNLKSACDFSYAEPNDRINPNNVFPGATIFMTGLTINRFFSEINPHIKHPYIIVDMSGGLALHDGTTRSHLDDPKVIAAFGNDAGLIQQHPKFTMIPIGIFRDIELFNNQHQWRAFFRELRNKPKNDSVYMNFSLHHWAYWRKELYEAFREMPWVINAMNNRKSFKSYMTEMANYKFTFSPSGDMFDCYRHWEAIMIGVIPIMKKSMIDNLFEGLPVLLIDDWNEITPEFLDQKYKEISSKQYNLEKLHLKYWFDKINAVKKAHGF